MASNPGRIGLNFASKRASKSATIFARSTTIERRSCSGFFETAAQRSWINSTREDPRSQLDRAAIAVRSDRDRGVLPRVAYGVGLESDAPDSREERETPLFTVAVGSRSIGKSSPAVHLDSLLMKISHPRDGDRTHQKTPRVSKIANDRDCPMTIG